MIVILKILINWSFYDFFLLFLYIIYFFKWFFFLNKSKLVYLNKQIIKVRIKYYKLVKNFGNFYIYIYLAVYLAFQNNIQLFLKKKIL